MSLQLIAKQMEAKGRNGDSVLVHMTTGEVAGLQKLAETAGGSLSVNPDTGLVEANFLKQMLPTLVGAGVGFFTANPMLGAAAGAAVGGYQANRAGQDVGAGMVMGGLGGYGGHTLSTGFQAAGAPAVTNAATKTATDTVNNAVMQQALGGFTPAQKQAAVDQGNMLSPMDRMAPTPTPMLTTTAGTGANTTPDLVVNPSAPPTPAAPMGFLDRAKSGFAGMENEAGRAAALKAMGGSNGLMNMLMMAGLPAMYGARTSVPHPFPLLSADVNKRGFADGGEVGFFTGGGTGQGNGLLSSLMGNSAYENRKLIIDPATGNVIRNPNLPPPAAATFANMVGSDGSGGGGGGIAPNPDFVTPSQKAAYYAERPNEAAVVNAIQKGFGYTPLGMLQERMDPDLVDRERSVFAGAQSGGSSAPGYVGLPADMRGVSLGTPGASLAAAKDYAENERQQNAAMQDSINARAAEASPAASGGADYSRTDADPDGMDTTGYSAADMGLAQGGLLGLAKGGMRSGGFVIPADVVSMVGEGNTDAGYKRIKSMVPSATAIKGKDGGQADTVKTSIEGKQPARVAHGEMYIPPETVKSLGGAKKLYAMMDRVRQQATGSKKQIKPVSLKRAMA